MTTNYYLLQLQEIIDFFESLDPYLQYIVPALIAIMGVALPIVVFLGMVWRSVGETIIPLLPANNLWIYLIIAIIIFVVGLIVNIKYAEPKEEEK